MMQSNQVTPHMEYLGELLFATVVEFAETKQNRGTMDPGEYKRIMLDITKRSDDLLKTMKKIKNNPI